MATRRVDFYKLLRALAKDARRRGDMQANRMFWQQIHTRSAAQRVSGRGVKHGVH